MRAAGASKQAVEATQTVDDRLKNIEPKMVELITNEACNFVLFEQLLQIFNRKLFLFFLTFIFACCFVTRDDLCFVTVR